jgi:hypothetical protein
VREKLVTPEKSLSLKTAGPALGGGCENYLRVTCGVLSLHRVPGCSSASPEPRVWKILFKRPLLLASPRNDQHYLG